MSAQCLRDVRAEMYESNDFVLNLFDEIAKAGRKVTDLVVATRAFLCKSDGAHSFYLWLSSEAI